ncbi:NADAR family protein [Micromonospora sp. WMMD980]|uniref:NADAR family protein n=1 Tax=Micromonospora sp. WMMD980 TaxID=3016088 RepID=UPI002415EEC1|nr:NADAR family protein [Micromonospora sp. WMMD980]MDG4800427.1 NADAR family protein [Micromonospora sp. WMMD980]
MLIRSVADLTAALDAGRPIRYLHFWGHRPQRDGSVGAGCLSQWWPAPFTVDGRKFATAEHWMMWHKATLFDDHAIAERVLGASHPHRAKALGRQVRGFDEAIWAARRWDIVVAGSVAKFGQHEPLRRFLLGTGDRVLVEASPTDRIWGIGLTADDPRAADPATWQGENLLGFALTEARARLAGQSWRAPPPGRHGSTDDGPGWGG